MKVMDLGCHQRRFLFMIDSRHPYTYADDLIRSFAGYTESGTKLSRADASQILIRIAEIIGMDHYDLAVKLADYYVEHEAEITDNSVTAFMKLRGWQT